MNNLSYLMALCQLQNVPYSITNNTFYMGTGTVVIPTQTIFKDTDFKKTVIASLFSSNEYK